MHLHVLIATHKAELLGRLTARLAGRAPRELERWLPVLLDRLADALESDANEPPPRPGQAATIASTAAPALPGPSDVSLEQTMRGLGITLDCLSLDCLELQQAVVELLFEEQSSLGAAQCEALARCVASVLAGVRAGREAVRERVVVVDTDRHVRALMQQFVGATYLVEFLDDGISALDRVRSDMPRLLVTEILVPRLDGLALCRLLKTDRATAHVPVLVLSVVLAENRALQSGADAFLEKPIEKRRLLASIHELTSRSPGPRPQDVAAE